MEQLRPKLDRKNAMRHINYDPSMMISGGSGAACASTSLSSSVNSIKDGKGVRRFLRFVPFASKTSFRVQGFDGELDMICKTLGLSGPEDLAISPDDWKARRVNEPSFMRRERFTDGFEAESLSTVEVNATSEAEECEEVRRIEVRKGGGCFDNRKTSDLNFETREHARNGGGVRLKGQRPPVLTQIPLVNQKPDVDMASSTWDICRSFGPQDDVRVDSRKNEEYGNLVKLDVGKLSCKQFRSANSVEKLQKDAFKEHVHGISPNGKFKLTISFWQKGDILGSGSFGTVYEGFTEYACNPLFLDNFTAIDDVQ